MSTDIRRTVDAVWRIESARIVATLAKVTGDFGTAEDLAQEALVEALEQWPDAGVPRNPGAWLTLVAKRRAIDGWRRSARLHDRERLLAAELAIDEAAEAPDIEPIDDDLLRLIFTACHSVLGRPAQVALTLRVVAGLSTDEIARMTFEPVATVQARITRAKKTLAAAHVAFETPPPQEWRERLAAVLAVIYLVFTEGYVATGGDRWIREEVANEALRLGRHLAGLLPREPEVHGLVALMELQASRFRARTAADGTPVLLEDQDRSRWDHPQIRRGIAALERADAAARARSTGRGSYALQAAIAREHAVAASVDATDWSSIVILYEALARIAPNPVVDLNRAVAVSMAEGPATALRLVDDIAASGGLRGSHLLPSVRGELLARLGRTEEARQEFRTAASLSTNERQHAVLRDFAANTLPVLATLPFDPQGAATFSVGRPDPKPNRNSYRQKIRSVIAGLDTIIGYSDLDRSAS